MDIPGPQGYDATVIEDLPNLTLRERTSDAWRRTDLLQGYDGNRYGVPVTGNADNIGCLPEAVGAGPRPRSCGSETIWIGSAAWSAPRARPVRARSSAG